MEAGCRPARKAAFGSLREREFTRVLKNQKGPALDEGRHLSAASLGAVDFRPRA